MNESRISTKDISQIGLFTALIAVMAQISIPMPLGVPMTMQTFAISLAGVMLGAKKGALSALAYALMGAVGAPVFAGFRGGLGIVLGPTGGFIISFPLMAWIIGFGSEKDGKWPLALGLFAGTAVSFIAGMIFFSAVTGRGLEAAFSACVLPFIPTSAVKALAAGTVGMKIRQKVMSLG
ncbi:MAG: biotin transporter BioY [Synergistaceae bacterium]|jgi:biotin transport system substrate-specific component|nr:biotin transporter BioY [Synergistaceae bacterium]